MAGQRGVARQIEMREPLTCKNSVELRGFEPLTPSIGTSYLPSPDDARSRSARLLGNDCSARDPRRSGVICVPPLARMTRSIDGGQPMSGHESTAAVAALRALGVGCCISGLLAASFLMRPAQETGFLRAGGHYDSY